MDKHFNIENGRLEESEDVTMIRDDTDTSDNNSKIDINQSWSPYTDLETLPFKNNVCLRHNRFNPNKNYLLGDKTEVDSQDEITYLHWIQTFLMTDLIKDYEILTTSVAFEDSINFSSDAITDYVTKDRSKYSAEIKNLIKKSTDISSMIITEFTKQINLFEVPVFRHLLFLDNIAKSLIFNYRDDSSCNISYNDFKNKEVPLLVNMLNEIRKVHYINITNFWNTKYNKYIYVLDIKTKTPMLSICMFGRSCNNG